MYGVDLVETLRAGRYRYLMNLLKHLPRASLFKEALSQDDELAEQQLAKMEAQGLDPEDTDDSPRLSDYTFEAEVMSHVLDRLGDVVSAVVGSTGRKPKRIPPMKRPTTAWTRVQHKQRVRRHQELVRRVLPLIT